MPATSTVTVHRYALSLALLPGVTGRRDVFAEGRAEVLAALRPALQNASVPGGTVTVVAPALRTRTTTGAQPDLGASGVLLPGTGDAPGRLSTEPALHVTASAAVALVRLAGWTAEITTHEVGADIEVGAAAALSARALTPAGAAHEAPADPGAHLVIFACALADGVLPVGASASLAAAEARVHALYQELVDLPC